MIARSAPTAQAARATPSTTPCGSSSISVRSSWAPGSASKPLAMTNRSTPRPPAERQSIHLRPVGKAPPPRPRRPESVTTRMTCSGVIVETARRHAVHAPCFSAVAKSARSWDGSYAPARASRIEGQPWRICSSCMAQAMPPCATCARSPAEMTIASSTVARGRACPSTSTRGVPVAVPRQSVCSRRTAPSGLTPPTSVPRCSRNAARTRPLPRTAHVPQRQTRTTCVLGGSNCRCGYEVAMP